MHYSGVQPRKNKNKTGLRSVDDRVMCLKDSWAEITRSKMDSLKMAAAVVNCAISLLIN